MLGPCTMYGPTIDSLLIQIAPERGTTMNPPSGRTITLTFDIRSTRPNSCSAIFIDPRCSHGPSNDFETNTSPGLVSLTTTAYRPSGNTSAVTLCPFPP